MPLGVLLAHVPRLELLSGEGVLFCDGFSVCCCQFEHFLKARQLAVDVIGEKQASKAYLNGLFARFVMFFKVCQFQALGPALFMEVHEHALLCF
jgi:hypothetical protein